MSAQKTSRLCRWQGFGILIMALLLGCSSHHLPNAPDYGTENAQAEFAPEVASAPSQIRIALAPFARSKPTGDLSASKIMKKRIGKRGGILSIAHEHTRALFAVPPKALKETTNITMQILGSGIQSIIEFGPDGLHFDRSCVLTVTFPSEGIDPDILGGYLLHEDGTTTEVPTKVIVVGNRIVVILQLDHFSQWAVGEG